MPLVAHSAALGFDPWDVSQQGLADLLETEAEQKQSKPHTLMVGAPPSDPTSSSAASSTAAAKKVRNGLTINSPFLNHHHQQQHQQQQQQQQQQAALYKHWQQGGGGGAGGGLPSSSSAPGTVPGAGGVVDRGSDIAGGGSVRDEFRALFPNVNISFGGMCCFFDSKSFLEWSWWIPRPAILSLVVRLASFGGSRSMCPLLEVSL